MKRQHKYWPYLSLMVLCVVFSAGYLTLAQEQESVAQTQEQGADIPQISTGEPGIATKGSSINLADLAKRKSLLPVPYSKPKVIREPGGPGPLLQRRAAASGNAAQSTQAPDNLVEPNAPAVASPAPLSTFKALEDNNTSIPPDTHGAVGPSHLMVVLNTEIRIQTRTGAAVSTVSLDQFWAGMPGPWASGNPATFDPKVLYDPYNNRWIFTVVADGDELTSAVLVAVSKTSDPTGAWNRYKVDADPSTNINLAAWADYPSLGFNKNWIVVTINMFGISDGNFKRSHIYAFNKAKLYAGTGPFKVFKDANGFTQAPAITYDNALNPLYLVEDWNGTSQLRISSLGGTAAAPTYSATHFFPTSPAAWNFQAPNGDDFAPQKGSTTKIQNNDSRIQNVVYRGGSLWCVQTIFLPGSPSTPTHSAIQWWELTPTSAVIKQRGRIDDPTGAKFYAFPSIAVNAIKDVLIGYSSFSSQQYASASYSFRAGTDAANTLRDSRILKVGGAPYNKDFGTGTNRWGDYSSTVVDPLNDRDLWTIQEHAAPVSGGFSRWGTWWGRIGPSVVTPLIQLGNVVAADTNAGDADTVVEPGEGGKLTVQLKNTGNGAATGVSGKLTTSTPGVTITSNMSAYPNLAAKTGVGNNTTPFTFNVASTVPCGQSLSFTLTVTFTGAGSPVTLNFTVPTGKAGTAVTKNYAGAAQPIPDNNSTGVNLTLAVSGFTGNITDLNFKIGGTSCTTAVGSTTVGLDHTWVGDIVMTLKSPQGTTVTIINQAGGVNNGGHNFCNTVLDDESAGASIQNITPAQAPYTGSFKPASPLSAFDGQNANGTWTLNVSDRGLQDSGNIRAFSLIITPLGCSTTAQATPVEVRSDNTVASLLTGSNPTPSQIVFNPMHLFDSANTIASVNSLIARLRDDQANEPYLAMEEGKFPGRIEDELVHTSFVWKRYHYMAGYWRGGKVSRYGEQ